MLVHVKKKAQITIPLKIREAVGIAEGDVLDVEVRNKEIVMKAVALGKMKVKFIDAKEFSKLKGIISLGGDAVKDTERLYE
ncbi:MAG: AbrB/MazE/SpoVT family DNA-binding domain-containing protein [Nitrospirae bacterium]|nr:AbrB/MazE/SpoVT family DNA-binding domain-containing protein [Nitrospirota bacterium]